MNENIGDDKGLFNELHLLVDSRTYRYKKSLQKSLAWGITSGSPKTQRFCRKLLKGFSAELLIDLYATLSVNQEYRDGLISK